jgi:hypothetical protein
MTSDEKLERLRELVEKNSQAVRELKDSLSLEAERSRLDLRAVKDSLTVEAFLSATRERQYSQPFLEHQEWLRGWTGALMRRRHSSKGSVLSSNGSAQSSLSMTRGWTGSRR